MRTKFQAAIKERIQSFDLGYVFSASDFFDIASADAANKALSRLEMEGTIRRIIQGFYDVPHYSEVLKEYSSPNISKLAHSIARKYNWTIVPSGLIVLNQLGLSTQVPNLWSYASSGPSRAFDIDGISLQFKGVKSREIVGLHPITASLIQAIRALGKDDYTEREKKILRQRLSNEQKQTVLNECIASTVWIADAIKNTFYE